MFNLNRNNPFGKMADYPSDNRNPDYLAINKVSWNKRTEVHVDSAFYDNASFLAGRSSLNEIELRLLGNISGKSLLHLQCHFGQDTISLSRLGARAMGVDFSDKAIEKARELAALTGAAADFICCDVYELPKHLDEQFDIVFTSYGVTGWLPDLEKWAGIVSRFLKPGGRFVFVEFHPVVWMFDDDFRTIHYRYFNSGPIIENSDGTYTDRNAPVHLENVMWNHGIGETVNALLQNGLEISALEEYDYSPYNCFNGTVEYEPGKFRIKHLGDKIPMTYSLACSKPQQK